MSTQTQNLILLWKEARTRFYLQLEGISEDDLKKKLLPEPNSVGFLIRHIGDVELLFARNVFGDEAVKVVARTVIDKHDTGEWTNRAELMEYVQQSFSALEAAITHQTDADWDSTIETREFGVKTKAEALGRIISHTAYHAGQIAMICKYGSMA